MKVNKAILGFDDRLLRIIGIPTIGFLIPLIFFGLELNNGMKSYWIHWLVSSGYTFIYWEVDRWIIIRMRRRFPGREEQRRRLIYQSLLILAFTLSFCNIFAPLTNFIDEVRAYAPGKIAVNVASIIATIIVTSIYETAYFFAKYKDSQLEAEQLKRANIQSQLDSLRNQVKPHFLFNSLNTLAALIPEDREKAVSFVQKLSKVYRHILEIKDQELISLAEELSYLEAYIFLVKTRFGDNLHIHINVPPGEANKQVVPLSLQILVENAIKHNVISSEYPLTIEIYIENDRVVVRNNLQKKQQEMPSTKTGLKNLVERYRFLSEQLVETIVTTTSYIVTLPLLNIEAYESAHYRG